MENIESWKGISASEATRRWQQEIGVTADGIFGPATEAATKKWQAEHGLDADGIVGRITWGALLGVVPFDYPPTLRRGSSSSGSSSPAQPQVVPSAVVSSPISATKSFASFPFWAGLGLLGAAVWAYVNERDGDNVRRR